MNMKSGTRVCLAVLAMALMLAPLTAAADHQAGHQTEEPPTAETGAKTVAAEQPDLAPKANSAVLMDADTGKILFEKNMHDRLPPASITKIMTMLLIMEALADGSLSMDEKIRTSEHAASMGGSQIFLEPGEEMSVRDMLKGIAMASGNDASVAMAEKIAGSEQEFVRMMNEKAKELGMKDTHFANTNGLPVDNHLTSAHDIAVMSRELLKHEKVLEFTGKYQDYLREDSDDPFWLVNTNKLVRFYPGADGIKTGYTSKARFCLSATAKRGDFRVIAIVLGEPDTKTRNAEVTGLFDYAFSQYESVPVVKKGEILGTVNVEKGDVRELELKAERNYNVLMKKSGKKGELRHELLMDERVEAPVQTGDVLGHLKVYRDDREVASFEIKAPQDVNKAGWWRLFTRTMERLFFVK